MRPLSVTIVGWWLIVTSLLGVYHSATMHSDPLALRIALKSPVSLQVQEIFGIINGIGLALCGIAILRGRSWARAAFVGWSLVGFFFGIFAIGFLVSAIFVGLSVGVIMYFLCRPRANEWFATAP